MTVTIADQATEVSGITTSGALARTSVGEPQMKMQGGRSRRRRTKKSVSKRRRTRSRRYRKGRK
jgi:hypothetical protein